MPCDFPEPMKQERKVTDTLLGGSCRRQCMFAPFRAFVVVEAHVAMASPPAWVPDGSVNILPNL